MFKSKIYLICIISQLIFSCVNNNKLIKTKDIEKVLIIEFSTKKVQYEFNNETKIANFITEINTANREIIKFYPHNIIEVYYKNGSKNIILSNSNNLKMEGLTYSMKKNLTDIIN